MQSDKPAYTFDVIGLAMNLVVHLAIALLCVSQLLMFIAIIFLLFFLALQPIVGLYFAAL